MSPIKTVEVLTVALTCLMVLPVIAEEIQACADETRTVKKSPPIYKCDIPPKYTVSGPAATGASDGLEFETETGTFMVNLDSKLTLNSVGQCPVQLKTDVTCDHFRFSVGSGPGKGDGTPVGVGGMGADGLVEWECLDTTTPSPINLRYYFLVKFVDDGTDLGTPATTALDAAKDAGGASTDASSLDPTVFQKFSQVVAETQVFYLKTPGLHHFIFKSKETTITLLSANYLAAVTSAQNAVSPENVCENAVRVCFTERCEHGRGEGSSSALNWSFSVMAFSMTMFTMF